LIKQEQIGSEMLISGHTTNVEIKLYHVTYPLSPKKRCMLVGVILINMFHCHNRIKILSCGWVIWTWYEQKNYCFFL